MEEADRDIWWPRWMWVGECFFWYWLTRVVADKIHRAIKWLCVCLLVQNIHIRIRQHSQSPTRITHTCSILRATLQLVKDYQNKLTQWFLRKFARRAENYLQVNNQSHTGKYPGNRLGIYIYIYITWLYWHSTHATVSLRYELREYFNHT